MTDSHDILPEVGPEAAIAVDPRLLELLVCPVTRTALEYNAETRELISRAAGLAYPIRAGIAIMDPEQARQLDATKR